MKETAFTNYKRNTKLYSRLLDAAGDDKLPILDNNTFESMNAEYGEDEMRKNLADSGTFYERDLKKNGKQSIIDRNRRIAKEKPPGFFSKINNRKGTKHTEEHKKNLSIAIRKWHNERKRIYKL